MDERYCKAPTTDETTTHPPVLAKIAIHQPKPTEDDRQLGDLFHTMGFEVTYESDHDLTSHAARASGPILSTGCADLDRVIMLRQVVAKTYDVSETSVRIMASSVDENLTVGVVAPLSSEQMESYLAKLRAEEQEREARLWKPKQHTLEERVERIEATLRMSSCGRRLFGE